MKRTILVAVLLVACILTATVGGTVAWFTDTVSTSLNNITAGNLDIELYKDGQKVEADTEVFTLPELWEPGAVAYANLSVKNEGSLALQYSMTLNTDDKNFVVVDGSNGPSLVDVLKVAVLDKAIDPSTDSRADILAAAESKNASALNTYSMQGTLDVPGEGIIEDVESSAPATLVVYWPSTNANEVDNQFNLNNGKTSSDGQPLYVNLGINIEATQLMAEHDSFGPDYDANSTVILPSGVTAESFTNGNVIAAVTENGTMTYHKTMLSALSAINGSNAVIYCKPDADIGAMTHVDVANNLTVYGNDAYISSGEADFEVDVDSSTTELTLNIYDLNGVAVWGGRETNRIINVNLYGCEDMNRVYISGTAGTTNVNIENCSYDGTTGYSNTAVYTNNPGTINVKNTTIKAYAIGINQNNKSSDTQNINLTNCTFIDCATETIAAANSASAYAAPVRVVASAEGAISNLALTNCNFSYSDPSDTAIFGNVLTRDDRVEDGKDKPNNGTVNVTVDGKEITGGIGPGRIENTGSRYQISADFAATGVKTLAVHVLDSSCNILTTITPETYEIPENGVIGNPTDTSHTSRITICAAITGNSSSWQNTPFTPITNAVPAKMELVVNGVVIASTNVSGYNNCTWEQVVAAANAA